MHYNTTGYQNTAVGRDALTINSTGSTNTAIGVSTLGFNTTGIANTASGAYALYGNSFGYNNVASGAYALYLNYSGNNNTATGFDALYHNSTGYYNTANGAYALISNGTGYSNTALGYAALYNNTTGASNTASGHGALFYNSYGSSNSAYGENTLFNSYSASASNNTAVGFSALFNNTTGGSNIALGESAGINLTTGSNNINIGNKGVAGESKTIRIGIAGTQTATFVAGIRGTTVAGGIAVLVDANGRLGTTTSSARFKDQIKPMAKASESILELEPVTFHYKKELDPDAIPQFGLVAEEVAKVNPDLVVRDEQGKPYTVRYEAVNAMLLNEFLKEHRKVEEQTHINQQQETTIARLEAALKKQAAQIQKVSTQMQIDRATSRVVEND